MEEKIIYYGTLLELYGELLTDKQYSAIDKYYNMDLSLSEIAQEDRITRQAVRDNIKKAEEKLEFFESKLKLYKNFKKEEVTSHFFQTLQEHGYRIGKSQQTIYARLAKEKIARYLEIEEGHAILALTQVSYLDDGTAFEYVKSQYVGERFEFYLENN